MSPTIVSLMNDDGLMELPLSSVTDVSTKVPEAWIGTRMQQPRMEIGSMMWMPGGMGGGGFMLVIASPHRTTLTQCPHFDKH